jgi:N-methylhydantoinase B
MNAPLSVTASGVFCGLKTAVDPNNLIPPNSGCWRSIEIRAAKGSVVNAAFPAPVVYANHEMSHRVADMVMGALASFMPGQVMACSQGTSAILTLGGVDPRSGRHYVSYETVKGGYGARPNKDGINCIASRWKSWRWRFRCGSSAMRSIPTRAAPGIIAAAVARDGFGACWRVPMRPEHSAWSG